jgi:hypothetical protein
MKRKLGDLAPGHTIHMQCKQALPSGLTYNLHLLKYALSWPLPTLRPASKTLRRCRPHFYEANARHMSTDRGWLRGGPAQRLTSQNPSIAKSTEIEHPLPRR